jgi:hypothetical protein
MVGDFTSAVTAIESFGANCTAGPEYVSTISEVPAPRVARKSAAARVLDVATITGAIDSMRPLPRSKTRRKVSPGRNSAAAML